MRAKHVIKTSLKTSKARNAANLKATHAMKTTLKVVHAMETSCKRHALRTLNGEQNMKDTMKLGRKRHMRETANWKATHAVETT